MNLVIDLGNTRVKYAIFDNGGKILFIGKTLRRYSSTIIAKIPKHFVIKNAILANTSVPSEALLNDLRAFDYFLHLDHSTSLPIVNGYETPETLGKDRLAAAVSAYSRYPDQNTLFIDMGTCITMNFINDKGIFLGGNISPGINMRLKAMHKFTANLPLVKSEINLEDFGLSTVKALQNGAVKGTFREIESFIEDMNAKFGVINVILTGGDADYFVNWSKKGIFVAPNLVMEGLNEILKYNVK